MHKSRTSNWWAAVQGNVFHLGMVSFFTDFSSEMIYPLLPVFFTGLVPPAAAAVYIGLMDGLAESTASLLKIYAGRLSDRWGTRKPLALGGYALSSLARPVVAFATAGWHVIALRFADRIGKGVRTSPRDALISDSVPQDVRGVAFSFHRMMDHAGAVAGPLAAVIFLYAMLGYQMLWHRGNDPVSGTEMHALRWLFGIALIPGIAAITTLWLRVREPDRHVASQTSETTATVPHSTPLPRRFYGYLAAVVLFTLGNSSDLFLVFYAQTRYGLGLGWIIVLWIWLHISKIVFSLPGGKFADRVGRRPAILIGWAVYALVYVAIPFASSFWMIGVLFLFYGAYYGMTEGAERALVADFVPATQRGKAYGVFHGAVGFSALPASFLFGVFWAALGARTAFFLGAAAAAGALLVLAASLAHSRSAAMVMEGAERTDSIRK